MVFPSPFITLRGVSIRKTEKTVLKNLDWIIHESEHWAIVGPNGAGKTTLAEAIAGKGVVAKGEIQYHTQQKSGKLPGRVHMPGIELVSTETLQPLLRSSARYYQQRFNSLDAESAPLVREILVAQSASAEEISQMEEWASLLEIQPLLDRRLIKLSNGETKRVLLAKALLRRPALLILDNPFIGLDSQAREMLKTIINRITQSGTQLLLVASAAEELPEAITHVLQLENGRVTGMHDKEAFLRQTGEKHILYKSPLSDEALLPLLEPKIPDFSTAVRMQGVKVTYNGTNVLDCVDWTVLAGEKWALLGPNGSGKSTLLSLINGDNPQAYANDIGLFDRQRGSGESIWEIKRQIGFVSPELHLYYPPGISCLQVVASGHFDRIGGESSAFFRPYSPEQTTRTHTCFQALSIQPLMVQPFSRVSTGEQRLVLLARALVKNPPLLILDEPCQGLDFQHRERFNALVDRICSHPRRTLIYVTHYDDEIPACVTRILRLDKGKVVADTALLD